MVAATQAAHESVAGLAADGPVRLVNAERARLMEQIERADRATAWWKQAAAALGRQVREQRVEADQQEAIVTAAEATAARVRKEVATPLIEQATADATARLAAQDRMWAASAAHGTARRIGRRRTARAVAGANEEHNTVETAGRARWHSLPETEAGVEAWATSMAHREADADPRVTTAQERAAEARQEQHQLTARQMQERADLRGQVFGDRKPSDPHAQAARWQERAETARRDLTAIEALPTVEAAQLIRTRAAQEQAAREAAEHALAERRARAAQLDFTPRTRGHGPTPPSRGLGL
ncbi:hypothetical protein AB1K54_10615 [Microbacterium sp. BWT-B31]|uniref:hypothetical protein n=1 Tax=Microbacterium sp. BWT-B31 TaxID=3232072 RepID=UPI0035279EE3